MGFSINKGNTGGNIPTSSQQSNNTTGLGEQTYSVSEYERSFNNIPGRSTLSGAQYVYEVMEQVQNYHPEEQPRYGVPSLMNPYVLFMHPRSNDQNGINKYFDIDGEDNMFSKSDREVSISKLLNDFAPDKKLTEPYYANDFIFSKYYGTPLNRLITLRRFPFPTYDNLEFRANALSNEFRPIAQAVTYYGDDTGNKLSSILKFNGSISWEELKADVHDVDGNEQSFDSNHSIFGGFGKGKTASATAKAGKFTSGVIKGASILAGKGDISGRQKDGIEYAKKFSGIDYTGRTLGPVNVINKTHVRGRGIGAEIEMNLIFEYKLRSYNGINPKLAMLDVIFNMLTLTFNNAKFWGGANRYFPQTHQFPFFGDQNKFYSGDYSGYMGSVMNVVKDGFSNLGDALSNLINAIGSGDFGGLAKIAGGVGAKIVDFKSAKNRPQVIGFKALLTGAPVGEWHVVIGNPMNPIAKIGNMICTGFDFEMGDTLGIDDFPEDIKFTVRLKSGRPRDKGDIESIFLEGQGRGYHAPVGFLDITSLSSSTSGSGNPVVGKKEDKRKKLRNDIEVMKKVSGTAF